MSDKKKSEEIQRREFLGAAAAGIGALEIQRASGEQPKTETPPPKGSAGQLLKRHASFDIDVIDSGFVPGTGWPEPGGFLPREALKIVEGIAKEGIVAMEVVEVSPPYDSADITSLLGARVMVDTLTMMVKNNRIGGRLKI